MKAGATSKFDVARARGAGTTVLAKPVGEAQVGVLVVVLFWGYGGREVDAVAVDVADAEAVAALQT